MPTSKNSMEMENHVFQKAKSKEEYLGFVARLILHVREMNSKKNPGMGGPAGTPGQNMQDPINALQTLARQGSGNQMMGLVPPQGPSPATNCKCLVRNSTNEHLPWNPLDFKGVLNTRSEKQMLQFETYWRVTVVGGRGFVHRGVISPQSAANHYAKFKSRGLPPLETWDIAMEEPNGDEGATEVSIPPASVSEPMPSTSLLTNRAQDRPATLRELRDKRLKLSIEIMEKESHLKSLEILKLERELGLSPSKFTATILPAV
ncbi:mediator complex subunit Med15 [Homalodisca vitripennis]|nr:mediator complex subunit Med15 [Homalodisca vitripennis]